MDFNQALNIVIGEITPQPWEWTDTNGATLTVIPRGWGADAGEAEVLITVTADKTHAAAIDITTADMPHLLAAIEAGDGWEFMPLMSDFITLTPTGDGGMSLAVTEVHYSPRRETTATVALPAAQRLPLISALRRATDVARAWED